jgi:hypothetical protein
MVINFMTTDSSDAVPQHFEMLMPCPQDKTSQDKTSDTVDMSSTQTPQWAWWPIKSSRHLLASIAPPAPIRITPVFQLPSTISSASASVIQKVIQAAILTLQNYVAVSV